MKHERNPKILAVDLDGTLIATDMLYETFWSATALRWKTPFEVMQRLRSGRASLKRWLAELGPVDVSLLPYNEKVISYIRKWREEGGKAVLVTASDEVLAQKIANHLGIFDEVRGSRDNENLKGERKAENLVSSYGENGFVYMGDTYADIPVWKKAAKAVSVNASSRLKQRIQALGGNSENISDEKPKMINYIKALRPHQWLKNTLVFLPMIAARAFSVENFVYAILAFISFSLVASSVYILNDLLDLSADRAHPRKCRRPFASGALPILHGSWMAPVLLVLGLSVAILLGLKFVLVLLGYYAVTVAYSFYLKRYVIIDIFTLAALYTARIIAGGVATDTTLSVWLLGFSMFFFFSLAAVKRQAELVDGIKAGEVTARGRGYHIEDVDVIAGMATSSGYVAVLIMALYINTPVVQSAYKNPTILWGICVVLLYWISRMVMVTHRGRMHDDPIVFAVKDRVSQLCLVVVLIIVITGTIL